MTEYQIYQIITTILFSLALLILAYDMGCRIRPPYNKNFGLIRFIVAVILMIGAIYTAGQIDNAKEQQNAKESNQHFEIERQDDLNNSFAISQKLIKEPSGIGNQWIVIS